MFLRPATAAGFARHEAVVSFADMRHRPGWPSSRGVPLDAARLQNVSLGGRMPPTVLVYVPVAVGHNSPTGAVDPSAAITEGPLTEAVSATGRDAQGIAWYVAGRLPYRLEIFGNGGGSVHRVGTAAI